MKRDCAISGCYLCWPCIHHGWGEDSDDCVLRVKHFFLQDGCMLFHANWQWYIIVFGPPTWTTTTKNKFIKSSSVGPWTNLYALRGLSFLSQKLLHMKTDYRSLYDRKHWTLYAAKLSPLTLSLGLFLFYIPMAELRGSSSSGSWVVCTRSHMCFILCSISSCSGKYILSIHCITAARYTGKMWPIMLPVTF